MAGFFKGTDHSQVDRPLMNRREYVQDARFKNKQEKLMAEMNFPPEYDTLVVFFCFFSPALISNRWKFPRFKWN